MYSLETQKMNIYIKTLHANNYGMLIIVALHNNYASRVVNQNNNIKQLIAQRPLQNGVYKVCKHIISKPIN